MEARTYNKNAARNGTWEFGLPVPYAYLPPDSMGLVNAVKDFQDSNGLSKDGKLGPMTYARMIKVLGKPDHSVNGIYIGGHFEPFPEAKVHTYKEDASLRLPCKRRKKGPNVIVLHYDVTFNARSTHRVLKRRGYSSHFCINHDGDLFQFADPADEYTYHAGKINGRSVGIDINNPADISYRDSDAKRRKGPKRDIIVERIHGCKVKRLSYFPEQLKTLRALMHFLCDYLDIPKEYPKGKDGKPLLEVYKNVKEFSGVVGHYHLTNKKTDPSPLNWEELFEAPENE